MIVKNSDLDLKASPIKSNEFTNKMIFILGYISGIFKVYPPIYCNTNIYAISN